MKEFTFFEFVRIGLPIALISFIWLMFFGIKDLAVREVDESNIPDTAERKPAKMVFVALIFLFIVYCMATKLGNACSCRTRCFPCSYYRMHRC